MTPTTRSDLMNNSSNMRIFEGRYFNINRRLLMCLGLWPYENKMKKYILRAIVFSLLTIGILTQLNGMYLHYGDIDRLMLSILCLCVLMVVILKILAMILAERNMISLHGSIANNWLQIQDYCERDILHTYSERARNVTIFYAAITMSSAFLVSMSPLIPKILDFIRPLENPRPNIYVTAGEIFIDRVTHFLLCFFLEFVGLMLAAFVSITVETMYIVNVEHCCALYAIIRSRLLELKPILREGTPEIVEVDSYEWLRRTIQIHHDALAFTGLLNDSYSISFVALAIMTLFIIPLDACAVIANLDNPLHLIPYALFLVYAFIHGFVATYPGQRVLDHQLSLLDAAYDNEWYILPIRSKKMLLIFMLRCSQPVMITVGDLLPVGLEIYFKILKTAISYITVVSSFR